MDEAAVYSQGVQERGGATLLVRATTISLGWWAPVSPGHAPAGTEPPPAKFDDRPRETLDWLKPAEALAQLLALTP